MTMTLETTKRRFLPREAAEYMGGGLKVGTLAAWRCARKGPAYVKIGARVLYGQDALDAYIAAHTVETTDGGAE